MSPSSLHRLRREAAVARDAASPSLVRVFDIGSSEQAVYLIMEAVDGESLRERLTRGPLPIDEAVRIAAGILAGLAALHSLGIVHRDVKPGNILLTANGEIKLADFGLALQWESDETRVTVGDGVVGTLDYVSPEQALGEEADPRSDLYSFGVVLFEMLAGRLPYQEKSSLGSLLGRLHKRAPDVRRLRPETPAWLAMTLERLLEKDPARRYPSAAAVKEDLRPRSALWTRGWPRPARFAVLAAVTLAVALAAVLAWRAWQRPRFYSLAPLEDGRGVAALDAEGKTLWKRDGVVMSRQFAQARLAPGSPPRLVAILRQPEDFGPETTGVLSVLDPETGEVEKRVSLPSAAGSFPSFSNQYGTIVRVSDLDHDGVDEVLVSYVHNSLWPSYTVLYEPRIERTRIVFVASGHHVFSGAHDLDGNGRAELIFSGINNRMGWFSAVAAVRVLPWIGETHPGQDHFETACSPDEPYSADSGALLWYALVPRSFPDPPGRLTFRPGHAAFVVRQRGSPDVEMGFDGFLTAHPSDLPGDRRQALRRDSYAHLREANRLLRAELPDEALGESETALEAAEAAGDPLLAEWISRVRGKILIAAGRFGEADAAFRELAAKPGTSASELAYDAGRAFHLEGELERAIGWYRQSIGRGASSERGRGKWEFLEGAVLALGELGRWEEALAEVVRYKSTYTRDEMADAYREYLRWRSGEEPRPQELRVFQGSPDIIRYWHLELRLAGGETASVLLRALEEEQRLNSETPELLTSLRGEILDRLGLRAEALKAAREAVRETRAKLETSIYARAHLDLVTERFARLATE